MRVLAIQFSQKRGGAANAANAFYSEFSSLSGVEFSSYCFDDVCLNKKSFWSYHPNIVINNIINKFLSLFFRQPKHSIALLKNPSLSKIIEKSDVLWLNWIGNGTLRLNQLPNNKPIIFCLHDEHILCGSSHYDINVDSLFSRYLNYIPRKELSELCRLNKNVFVTCPSKWLVERARSVLNIDKENVYYMPNFLSENYSNKLSSVLNESGDRDIDVLFLGGNGSRRIKGVDYAASLFEYFERNYPHIRMACIASDENKDLFIQIQNCEVLSPLPQDELIDVYKRTKVVIVPSVKEAFGMVALEGLSAGCLVGVTIDTGLADFLDHDNVFSLSNEVSRDAKIICGQVERKVRFVGDITLNNQLNRYAVRTFQKILSDIRKLI